MGETIDNRGDSDGTVEQMAQERKRKRRKLAVRVTAVIVLLLLILLGLRMCGVVTFPWERGAPIVAGGLYPGDGNGADGHLPDMTEEEILEQMQRVADAGYFSFKIEGRPVFEDGSSAGNLEIENPNYNAYLMVVQIFLADKESGRGELIYDSGGLQPNQYIDNDKLKKELSKGEYTAIAVMTFYDPDTEEKVGEHEAELVITIKN